MFASKTCGDLLIGILYLDPALISNHIFVLFTYMYLFLELVFLTVWDKMISENIGEWLLTRELNDASVIILY